MDPSRDPLRRVLNNQYQDEDRLEGKIKDTLEGKLEDVLETSGV